MALLPIISTAYLRIRIRRFRGVLACFEESVTNTQVTYKAFLIRTALRHHTDDCHIQTFLFHQKKSVFHSPTDLLGHALPICAPLKDT